VCVQELAEKGWLYSVCKHRDGCHSSSAFFATIAHDSNGQLKKS